MKEEWGLWGVGSALQYLIQGVHDPRTVLTLDLKTVFFAPHIHPLVVAIVVDDLVSKLT